MKIVRRSEITRSLARDIANFFSLLISFDDGVRVWIELEPFFARVDFCPVFEPSVDFFFLGMYQVC